MSNPGPIVVRYDRENDDCSGMQLRSMDVDGPDLQKVADLAAAGILETGQEGFLSNEILPGDSARKIRRIIVCRNNKAHMPENRSRSNGFWITLGAFDRNNNPIGMATVLFSGTRPGSKTSVGRWFWVGSNARNRGFGRIISRGLHELSFQPQALDVDVAICRAHASNTASLTLINEWNAKFVGREPSWNVPSLFFERYELEKEQWLTDRATMGYQQHEKGPYGRYTVTGIQEFLSRCNP